MALFREFNGMKMSGFPMPPPGINSSVLDRVKLFLPQIQKANAELELKIAREGTSSVQIDRGLGLDAHADTEEMDSEDIIEENDEEGEEPEGESTKRQQPLSESGSSSQNSQALLGGAFSNRGVGHVGTSLSENSQAREQGPGQSHSSSSSVVLEFALGDFDGTPIALAEAAAAAAAAAEAAVIAEGDESETAGNPREADQ